MAINYKQCPKCGSKNTMKILFGRPTHDVFQKAETGGIKLGGYSILAGGSKYSCNECEHEWNKEQALEAAYDKIKGLKASVGGYFDGYYNVEINLTNYQVSWSHGGRGDEELFQKTVQPAATKRFLEEVKLINLLDWKAKYIEQGVLDGTHWSVEVIRDGRNINKHGSNKFPDEWDALCKLISRFIGKKFS